MFLCSLSCSYRRWGVKQLCMCIGFDVSFQVVKVECPLLQEFSFKEFAESCLWNLGLSQVAGVTYFIVLSVLFVQGRLYMIFHNF